jgi:cardiolipin synthase
VIGSTNLNYRSFIHDLELDALITDIELVGQMQQRFERDLECCDEITLRRWQNYPWLLKLLGWLPRLMRYWL